MPRSRPALVLVDERRISDSLNPPEDGGMVEASGVVARDGQRAE
jgi:hypothetical protein